MGSVGKSTNIYNNIKFAPSDDDIISATDYFEGTDVSVNTSLADWKDSVDNMVQRGDVPLAVTKYLRNSSVNYRLREDSELNNEDKRLIRELDAYINKSPLKQDTFLYSGLSGDISPESFQIGQTQTIKSYVSTSPDPIYAAGYAGTNTVLQIEASKGTHVGKAYYEDSTGTEGILARNSKFTTISKRKAKISGELYTIIRVKVK
jgi:hypothetical protein